MDEIYPKKLFPVGNEKIALARASMVVTYYIKLFRKEPYKHNGVLMSLLLLVKETIRKCSFHLAKNILFYSKRVLHNK